MRNRLWRKLLTVLLVMTVIAGMMSVCAASDVEKGIDLVILIDSTHSMYDKGENDKEYKRLDAATMIVNMCDLSTSSVAVVPFTDSGNTRKQIDNNMYWGRWINISDRVERANFCNAIIEECSTFNGYTYYEPALEIAYNLLKERENDANMPVVLMLTDGENDGKENDDAVIAKADQIKTDLGAEIYCVYLNKDSNSSALNILQKIASRDSTVTGKHVLSGADKEMKNFFGNIFANLIGAKRKTYEVEFESDTATIDINIPTNSVYELNLVFPMELVKEDADIAVSLDGERIEDDESLFIYEHRTRTSGTVSAYDYYSMKLIQPTAGHWQVRFTASDDAQQNSSDLKYDILYNYDVNLMGSVSADVCHLNDTITVSAQFEKLDGSGATTDDRMYSVIPACVTVVGPDGNAVIDGEPMRQAADGLSYCYDLELSRLQSSESRYGEYAVYVHAEDDTMQRDLSNEVRFTLEDTVPQRTQETVDLGLLRIQDVLNPEATDETIPHDVSAYFSDEDGDALTYFIEGMPDRVSAQLDPQTGSLTVSKLDDSTVTDGFVKIFAADGQGNRSEAVTFYADILSVRQLVENCLTLQLAGEPDALHKGTTVELTATFLRSLPLGADAEQLPWSMMDEVLTDEAIKSAAAPAFIPQCEEGVTFEVSSENPYKGTVTAGSADGATATVGFSLSIGDILRNAPAVTYTVENATPECADITPVLTEMGGVAEATDDGEVYFLSVDKDKPDAEALSFDLNEWFTDSDMGVEAANEKLTYAVKIEPLEETKDIFGLARGILRTLKLTETEGPAVSCGGMTYDEESGCFTAELDSGNAALELTAERFGNALVIVTAKDNDEAESGAQMFGYHIASSVETIKCWVVYGILALILLAILLFLIDKLVIHAKWPGKKDPGYKVLLNQFPQYTVNGQDTSSWGKDGRKPDSLQTFARKFEISDGGAGEVLFRKIKLWPTTGNKITVELFKNLDHRESVKVNGQRLTKKGKKLKWASGCRIVCEYKDLNDHVWVCEFIRR